MHLPPFLAKLPRVVLILAFPLGAFILAVGLTLGMTGGDDGANNGPPAVPTLAVQVQNAPQPTATAARPTATAVPIRTDCAAIRGTDYRSDAEREWFQKNCSGTTQPTSNIAAATNPTPTRAAGSTASTTAPQATAVPSASTQSPPPPPPAAAGAPLGVEYVLGDQVVIPAIGLNASVTGMDVSPTGHMPDPVGYFNAVWYNFSALPGLGGYVNGGNLVMAGHVDCARCHNGASGGAVFYSTRTLSPGAEIQYYSGGQMYRYSVTAVQDYSSADNWAAIVAAGTADLTIITCNGTFDPAAHEYNLRNVVFARKIA